MKIIGITQRSLPPNEFAERRYALDERWFGFLSACGLIGVPLPNDPGIALRTVGRVEPEGIILSGGEDLADYGGPSPQRDRTERLLLAWAIRQRIPVLGVCRGMQLILHAFGVRLVPVEGHVATRHRVTFDGRRREVNSYHRWAARSVSAPLLVSAACADVVKAVRHRSLDVLGVMWHPEREAPFAGEDLAMVVELFRGDR